MRIAQSLCAYVIAFAICSLSTFSMFAQLPSYLPADGLVAWYPFNGNANDESGNGNNGVVYGATLTDDRFGATNAAYSFNSSYIEVPNSSDFTFSNFSFSLWIKSTTSTPQTILKMAKFQGAELETFGFGVGSFAQIQFGANYNDPNCIPGFGWQLLETAPNTDLLDNTYHHFVCTANGSIMSMYIDGQFFGSLETGNNPLSFCPGGDIQIGRNWSTFLNYYIGMADDIGIWNRPLSAQEAQSLFNAPESACQITASAAVICPGETVELSVNSGSVVNASACSSNQLPANLQNGLVAYYPFCGNANDASGNGNDGVVNGALLTNDRFGNTNAAYQFNNNFIRIPYNSILSPTSATVSIWLKVNGLFGQDQELLFAQSVGRPSTYVNSSYRCGQLRSAGNSWRTTSSGGTSDFATVCSETILDDGQWHHVVGTYTPTSLKIYVDGVLEATTSTSLVQNQNIFEDYYIGGFGPSAGGYQFFKGALDDLFIYNRVLNETEIAQLFASSQISWSNGATSPSISVTPAESTTYSVTVNQGGQTCTSDLTITVNQPSSASIEAFITEGETYDFNGQSLTSAGTYESVLVNAAGCDSVVTLTLTVNPAFSCEITASATSICAGESVELSVDGGAANTSACVFNQLPINLQNGLVAYYPFCGNANDASGNGNDGVVNGAVLTTNRLGVPNSAYYFNGNSSNIRVSHSASLTFTDNLTVSLWLNAPNYSLNNNQVRNAIGKRRTSSLSGWGIETVDDFQTCCGAQFFINNNTASGGLDYEDPAPMPINQWVHLVGIYDGQLLSLYQNGQLLGTATGMQNLSSTLQDMFIGSEYLNGSYFLGAIDDIFIWNRAISPDEVQTLYSANEAANVLWSTGATTPSITVAPTETTTYSVAVTQDGQTCTSDVTITVNQPSAAAIDASITEGETYTFNGQSLTSAGSYESVLVNAAGCDSVVTLTLTVNPALNCEITASATSICAGESVELSVDGGASNTSACASNQLPANLQNGLVAYYPFCGNANDASGNGNDGVVNGASLTNNRFGIAQSSFAFDGINDYIRVNTTANSNLSAVSALTISAWVNLPSNSPNVDQGFVTKWNPISASCGNPVAPAYWLGYYGQGNTWIGATNNNGNPNTCVGSNAIKDNQWHLLVYTHDASGEKFFVDGLLTGTAVFNGAICATANALLIGADNTSGQIYRYLKGSLDDIGIWNRALSLQEVAQLYNNQSVLWSTGATTSSITVAPTETTTYSVTVTQDGQTCTSDVTIEVLPTETFYADNDGDGFGDAGNSINACVGQPQGYVTDNTDCDDTNAAVFIGASCDDGDACTEGDIVRGDCTCAGTYADDDQDGTCNALDLCAFGPEPGTACDDNNPCTMGDSIQDDCTCAGQAVESETSIETAHACEPFNWNGEVYTQSGTYTYVTTNALGCDSIATLELTVGAPSSSSTTINACNGYTWNEQVYTQSGTYTFVTPNASGCDSTATLVLTIQTPSVAPTAINASSASVTVGGSVTLSVVGGSLGTGAQWKWYRTSCGGQFIGTGNSITVTVNATTTYFVRAEGDCNVTSCASVTITANAIPCGPQSVAASALSVCYGSSTMLTVSGQLNAGASWKWYKNACGSGVVVGTGSSLAVLPTATTTYFVRAEGGTCGITSCQSITITVNPAPAQPAFIQGPVNGLCGLQGVSYSTPAVSGASSYVWSVPTGATIVSGQGTNAIVVNFGSSLGINTVCGATSICVRSVSACGSSALRCVNLSVAPATPGAITGQSIVCRTQSYTYSIAAVAGATSYTWTVPSTWQITSGQGTTSITVVAGTMNGEVRVLANNACGSSKIARRSVTTFVCSNPGMTMLDEMPELALWPNPANDLVHLDVDQVIPDKVEIYDMLGKRMYEGVWTNEFDVTLWPSGMYIVRVTLGEEHLIQRLEIAH